MNGTDDALFGSGIVAVTCSTSSSYLKFRMDAQDNQKHNYESLS